MDTEHVGTTNNSSPDSTEDGDISSKTEDIPRNGMDKSHSGPVLEEFPRAADEQTAKLLAHKKYLAALGERWFTVEPLVIIYTAAYISLMPLFQQYIHVRLAEDFNITEADSNVSDYDQCRARIEVAKNTSVNEQNFANSLAMWNAAMMTLGIGPTLLVIFFVGSFSDTHGRRFGIVPQLAGAIVAGIATTLVMWLNLPLPILILVQLVVGLTGTMPAVLMASYSYIADINPPEKRFLRMLIVDIGMGVGALVGNLLFGWLIDSTGFVVPCIIATIIMIFSFLYAIIFIPETVLKDEKASFCNWSSLKDLLRLWFRFGGVKGRRLVLWLCLAVIFFSSMLSECPMMIVTIIFMDPPLCWTGTFIGLFNGVFLFLKATGGMALMTLLFGRTPPAALQLIGLVSTALAFVCLGLATQDWVPFLGAMFSGLTWAQMAAFMLGSSIYNVIYSSLSIDTRGYVFLGTIPFFIIPMAFVVVLFFVNGKPKTDLVDGETVADTDELIVN